MTLGNVASFNEVAFRDSRRGTQLRAICSPPPAARGMSDSALRGDLGDFTRQYGRSYEIDFSVHVCDLPLPTRRVWKGDMDDLLRDR